MSSSIHSEELNDMYSSPKFIPPIRWRIMRWARHLARRERRVVHTGFWWGNRRERDHLEDPGADRNIILRWKFRKWHVEAWTVLIWLRIGTDGGLF